MLYFISANYTPKAMQAMAKKPDTNRRDALEKLVKAAGGKVVAMYGTMVDGPGAMAIVDVDPGVGAAVAAVIASSDGVCNNKYLEELEALRVWEKQRPPAQVRPLCDSRQCLFAVLGLGDFVVGTTSISRM